MNTSPETTGEKQSRDAAYWAEGVSTLKVSSVPQGATNLNVDGRHLTGPLRGFGQMWQKTYTVRLEGASVTPAEVIRIWKSEFPRFQPPQNRFYPSVAGVAPGEVVLINASTPGGPISTGVLVLYADDESFTLITPEGHPESGWVTFSAFADGDCTVCQVQSIARANDPLYELAFRLVGSKQQEQIWTYVLTSLAENFGVHSQVSMHKVLVDPKMQWSQSKNIWYNAAMRTTIYTMAAPVRWARRRTRVRR
ncbi:MAG: DUF1990 domain-containing protein [Chloroflexota bacterium]|nr:DUF1990 domain-containing protein [Chloroflexota bacterium]